MQSQIQQNIYRQVTVLQRPNLELLEPQINKKVKIEEDQTQQQPTIWNTQSTSLKNIFMEGKIEYEETQFNPIAKLKSSDSEDVSSTCSFTGTNQNSTNVHQSILSGLKFEEDTLQKKMYSSNSSTTLNNNLSNIESLKMQLEPLKGLYQQQQNSGNSQVNQQQQQNCDNKNIQLKKLLQSIESQEYDQSQQGKKCFSCPVCQKSYSNKSYLKKHIIELHNNKNYECSQCQQTFETDQITFNLHVEKCKKNRVCAFCDAKGMNYEEFNNHMMRKHPTQVLQQKNNIETVSILECHICHKQNFKNVNILKQHIKKQHTDINLTCQYCSKNGFCRTSLQNHYKQQHIMDQKCQSCGEDKLSLAQIEQHEKKHQEENNKNNFYITGIINNKNQIMQQNQSNKNNTIEKSMNEKFSDLIQRDLNLKQKDLKQKIEEINEKQQYKYALKRSSYTQKINKILGL